MAGSPRQWSLGKQQTLALSMNSAFGIGLNSVTMVLLFLAMPSYLASTWVPVVLRRKREPDGNLVGTAHVNPALDTRFYEVRFPDGRSKELAANVIAEAVYAQCDADNNQYVLLDAIVDYRKDPSMAVSRNNQDGSCVASGKLSNLKESHPLQVAEFTFAVQIANEPAFNWWVNWVLKKGDWNISLVKCRSPQYHKRIHKYGIKLPKTVEEAYAIDRTTGTTFWRNAIEKEMKNVRVVFDVLADSVAPPADHQ
eukprot:CCRYP_011130-RA/>CCRYP_011130-RA protein AED:0.34 eAED:0.34 QI:0/0/0/1/0/0/3/0/252